MSAINYGYTESASDEDVGPKFLRITDIKDGGVDWESVPYCKIEESDVPKYLLATGDIVFARTGATTGKSFLVSDPPEAVFASYLIRLRLLNKELLPEFVSLFFQSADYWQSIKDGASGSAQGGFNATKLGALTICIPPLPEQRRIVAILDEAFDGIAAAKASAEKNLQNARALFESYLQSVFTERGEGWVTTTLGKCFRLKSGDGLTSKAMKTGQYPVYGGNGVTGMHNEFNLAGDNVIVGRVGALCGNARRITEKIWLTDNAFKTVDFCYEFDSAFLTYLLNFKNLRGLARQAAQPVISNSSLKDLVLDFPAASEQRRIANRLDTLVVEIERLELIYRQKLAALDELKKSLLHQAFSGQL